MSVISIDNQQVALYVYNMEVNYKITENILNLLIEFSRFYERIEMLPTDNIWLQRLVTAETAMSSLAAVVIDKDLYESCRASILTSTGNSHLESLSAETLQNFQAYQHLLQELTPTKQFSLESIEAIHNKIIHRDSKQKYAYRQSAREIDRVILDNGVYRTVKQVVKTPPGDIMESLSELINWVNSASERHNSAIIAAITHIKIAEIHPYTDGNGRLARIIDNQILLNSGINYYPVVSLEGYFLDTSDRYFDLIEKTISQRQYTDWIEYYLMGLLNGVKDAALILKKISGGAIDIAARKVVSLTEKETIALDIVAKGIENSGAGIARQMGVTRQSVNQLLHRLREKGLLEKTGEAAGSMFRLAS